MIVNDRSWYAVRNTPGVTGFVGSGTKPIPLTDEEVKQIMRSMGVEESRPKIDLQLQQIGSFENWSVCRLCRQRF